MYSNLKIGSDVFPFFIKLDVYRYIDALVHASLRETVLDGLVYLQHKYKVDIHCWIVLPDSLRLIISNANEEQIPEEIVDGFMNYTDKKLLQNLHSFRNDIKRKWIMGLFDNINRKGGRLSFWHSRYTLVPLHSITEFSEQLFSIHEAPVASGVVWDAQNYMYSSAIDYKGDEQGLLPVVKLETEDVFM